MADDQDYDGIVNSLRDQAKAVDLPLVGSAVILLQTIASLTIAVRDAQANQDLEPADQSRLARSLRMYISEWDGLVKHARSQLKPDKAYVSRICAAFASAVRDCGPDMTLRDAGPVIVKRIEDF